MLWESLIDVAEKRNAAAILLEVENEIDDPDDACNLCAQRFGDAVQRTEGPLGLNGQV